MGHGGGESCLHAVLYKVLEPGLIERLAFRLNLKGSAEAWPVALQRMSIPGRGISLFFELNNTHYVFALYLPFLICVFIHKMY